MAPEIKRTNTHAGNKAVSAPDRHAHVADQEETYDKIVGSLGDVNDEGCADTDGVRFIVNDVAYLDQSEQTDYTEVMKAIVIGDILNNPRFKSKYKKR